METSSPEADAYHRSANEAQKLVQAGDVAQYCAPWSLKGIDPTRAAMQLGGRSFSIL